MKNLRIGNRIIILGCPGSGKSTFAGALHARTGLPLIHLDNVWWNPDRTHIAREAFDRRLESLMQADRWILDGDYPRTYEARFRACDAIIFLDYGEETCMAGIRARAGEKRADLPWVEDAPDSELAARVRSYQSDNRPAIYALMAKYPEKQALVFRTRAQAEAWLSEL